MHGHTAIQADPEVAFQEITEQRIFHVLFYYEQIKQSG